MSNLKENIKAAQIDLIKELGIDTLESKKKEELLLQIGEILQQRIVLRIVEELPEEKQDEFNGILEKAQDNPDLLDQYLKENIPGVEDMILEEIGEYKKGASDFMKQTLAQVEGDEKEMNSDKETTGEEKLELEIETEAKNKTKKPAVEMMSKVSIDKVETIKEDQELKALKEKVETESETKKSEISTEELGAVEKAATIKLEETKEMRALRENIEKIKIEEENASENLVKNDKQEEVMDNEEPEIFEKEAIMETPISKELEAERIVEKEKILTEKTDLIEVEDQSEFKIGVKPIKKVRTENETSAEESQIAKTQIALTGIEQEQVDQEAQILEENKIENNQVIGEELDLSNEIGKMAKSDSEKEKKKE